MAGQIKGITIEFDADATKLTATLNKIKSESKSVDSALREVNRQLKFDPKNTELLGQKQTLLKQKIDQTKTSLEQMRQIQKDANEKHVDKQSAAYMKLRREIIRCEGQLKAYNAQMAKAKFSGLRNAGKDIQDVGMKLSRATRYARMFALAITGIALYKGFERLKSLDEVSKQLEVLGYRGEKLNGIMESVSGSVNGTRFMLQDMAKVATGALGSGVTEKYDLNDYLTRTADLAQLAGLDVQSMGAMMNKAYSKGKVDAKIMNQLNAHGIPIYKLMQKELGVTADELAEMSKKGKLSFDDLYRATSKYEGLAQKMGTETLPGAMTVLTQQFGLVGADFLQGVYEPLKEGTQGIVQALKTLRQNGTFKEWGQDVGDTVKYFVEYFKTGATSMDGLSDRAQSLVQVMSPLVTSIGKVVEILSKLPPQMQGLLAFMTLFGGPLLTAVGGSISLLANAGTQIYTIGLNAAAGVGPLGALTTSIGGMSGAVSLLLNPLTLATLAVGAWALGVKKTNDELHASTIAFEEWKAGSQTTIEAAQASGTEVDLYKQKLMSLMEKEKKSAGDKALIKTYVDKLNGAISGLNLKYDEEKDKLNQTSKAIEKKVESYKKAAVVKAYEDLITEAAKKEAQEQLHLQELYKERKKVQDKWNNSAEHSALLETQYKQSMAEVNIKITDSKKAISGYRQEMDAAGNAVTGLKNKSKKGFQETATAAKNEGKKAPKEYGAGMTAGAGAATRAASKVAKDAAKKLDVDTTGEGRDFANGFGNGISSKINDIASKAASLVKKAISAARNAQDSGSPSRIMRDVGREYGQGYVLGIGDEMNAVRAASGRMVQNAIQTATVPATGMSLQSTEPISMVNNFYINGEGKDEQGIADAIATTLETRLNMR